MFYVFPAVIAVRCRYHVKGALFAVEIPPNFRTVRTVYQSSSDLVVVSASADNLSTYLRRIRIQGGVVVAVNHTVTIPLDHPRNLLLGYVSDTGEFVMELYPSGTEVARFSSPDPTKALKTG